MTVLERQKIIHNIIETSDDDIEIFEKITKVTEDYFNEYLAGFTFLELPFMLFQLEKFADYYKKALNNSNDPILNKIYEIKKIHC